MSEAIIESVPNFAEGRDRRCIESIVAAMQVEGVRLLELTMDADHNRTLVTVAGPPQAVVESVVRGAGRAAEVIDLTRQEGLHPRIGAADVIPFVPVTGIRLEQCVLLARQAGQDIWRRYGIPVYFYASAASRPDRMNLDTLRQGQFEGLRDAVRKDATRRPDLGGPNLHPSAGACAVGARKFLVEYNLYFDTPEVSVARSVARELRATSLGLKGVKSMAMMAHGRAQLAMTIEDFKRTPVSEVFRTVSKFAQRLKTSVVEGEILGLIPEEACERESEWMRLLVGFDFEAKLLERRLQNPMRWPGEALESVSGVSR